MCLLGDFYGEICLSFELALVVEACLEELFICLIGDTYLTAGLLVNGEIWRRGETLARSVLV